MCGIAGIFGENWSRRQLGAMVEVQQHRGPDATAVYYDPSGTAGLGHNRLSIIDLSEAGNQPMRDRSGNYRIILNGEIYNYPELRMKLKSDYEFITSTDTEVLLAAYIKWGEACLEKLIGMFSFVIWDQAQRKAFCVRDRFGVKPLYYHETADGTLIIASEIKAIHAAGVRREINVPSWSSYLTHGLYDHSKQTFWEGIHSLRAGEKMTWKNGRTKVSSWYDLAERVDDELDTRSENEVQEEYFELLKNSVKLRFRSDVPVGINLSGGLDSSSLLGIVHAVEGAESDVKAFTFVTGNEEYDEISWVREMLERTKHELVVCELAAEDVPRLASDIQRFQDEPFGGIPTLAYARVFEEAKRRGVTVLLDGNGMDEQWAGYDYYQNAVAGKTAGTVQGTNESPVRPECLDPEFLAEAKTLEMSFDFKDRVRGLQYRDTKYTKIPRALRFNDRISMRSSTELREPFLDHRLFELAFRQPTDRKITNGTRKKMLRDISRPLLSKKLNEAPKRAVQTPQREWLRGELRDWADSVIRTAVNGSFGSWFQADQTLSAWQAFCEGKSDNSFYVWQWLSVGMMEENLRKDSNGRSN